MTTQGGKEHYFVKIPDLPTADRARVRPLHIAGLAHAPASHTVFMGGGYFSSQPTETSKDFKGSAVILEFDTAGEQTLEEKKMKVIEYLKGDPYVKEGVWDLDKVEIWPFKTGYSEVEVTPR